MMRLLVVLSAVLSLSAVRAQECGLYLAESSTSTKEDPKWGVYAGVAHVANVTLGEPDVGIQLINLMAHTIAEHEDEEDEKRSLQRLSAEMLERYTWVPDSSGALFEISRQRGKLNTGIPGAGLLAAFNGKLTNAKFLQRSAYFRSSMGETPGLTHPGRGASSHFYNVSLTTVTSIPAGHEIFMDYGENFVEDPDDPELTIEEHQKVDALVNKMIAFMEKHKDELDAKSKADIYNFLIHDVMTAAAGEVKGQKVVEALPETPDELYKVQEAGGSLIYSSPNVKRDLSWLQQEGLCMDHLVAGPSTIPHAGRGAFAKRSLKEGTTIAPIPLIQLSDKTVMDMYELEHEGKRMYRADKNVLGSQQALNYCFGHSESNMLFFPAGSVVSLVNHDSQKPNAKLVWSKHSLHHAEWLQMDPASLVSDTSKQYLGLLMELVATRDIAEGEEVLLDYGPEWAAAWEAHVKNWNDKVASGDLPKDWPIRALDLNQDYKTKAFETPAELEKAPYPDNVHLRCFLAVDDDEDVEEGEAQTWALPEKGSIFESKYLLPCTVKDRVTVDGGGMYNYTAVISEDGSPIQKVPHEAFVFVDNPGTSDLFVKESFRHAIGIPDDVFPKGPWRNAATSTK